MKPEKRSQEQEGAEQSPEIVKQVQELDHNAGQVAEELEGIDPEDISPEERFTVGDKVGTVVSAIFVLAGGYIAYEAGRSPSLSDLKGATEVIEGWLRAGGFGGSFVVFAGIGNLMRKWNKFKEINRQKETDTMRLKQAPGNRSVPPHEG